MQRALLWRYVLLCAALTFVACEAQEKANTEEPAPKSSEQEEEPVEEEEEDESEEGAKAADEEGSIGKPQQDAAPEEPKSGGVLAEQNSMKSLLGTGASSTGMDSVNAWGEFAGNAPAGGTSGGYGLGMSGSGRGGGGTASGSFGVGGMGTRGRGSGSVRPRLKPAPSGGPVVKPGTGTDWGVNAWFETEQDKLSTFAVDVDTGSYTVSRRSILSGSRPAPSSVRVEEFVNYFQYNYPAPTGKLPFEVSVEAGPSPFNTEHMVMRVGVQGEQLTANTRKPVNLTFLVDVSGSMGAADKLPLAKKSLRMIVEQMQPGDTIALVTYAGNTRVVLEPTEFKDRAQIEDAIEDLSSGGSTAMQSGLVLAYKQAMAAKRDKTVNRVIVLSDGDANVGKTGHSEILKSIEKYVDEGITLSTVGFGRGNYQDTKMEQLANKGNGNYYYIDTPSQAKRVFQEQLGGTLQVIAKDVKIQVEFDPNVVEKYRLIGYENRDIADKDFRNDKVDAGEIGAGHSVTAVYELKLKEAGQGDVAIVRLRHKEPDATKEDPAVENAWTLSQDTLATSFDGLSEDTRFAVAVVAFAEILRKSPGAKDWKLEQVGEIARAASGNYPDRSELVTLVDTASKQPPHSASFAGVASGGGLGGLRVPRPKLKPANPQITGSLDRRIIRKVINQHKREVKKCYETELAKDSALAGKVEISWVINADGKVQNAQVQKDGMGNAAVAGCLAKAVSRWRFPKPKGGGWVKVTYPFVFSSR